MDRKGTKMFLSFLRGVEAIIKFQAMNRRVITEPKTMLGRPLSLQLRMSLQTTVSHELRRGEGLKEKIPKCFSSPGDCKELFEETKRSTYD